MKIAWFTPFSNNSAIGEYSRKITERLAPFHEVELWLATSNDAKKTDLKIVDYGKTPEALEQLAGYDAIVYNMGNYLSFHKEIYEISRLHKGIVILHDLVLHHFFAAYYLIVKQAPHLYLEKMEEFYGLDARVAAEKCIRNRRSPLWERDEYVVEYPFFEEAIFNAEGVIVHSQTLASVVTARWLGPVKTINLPGFDEEIAARLPNSRSGDWPSSGKRLLLVTLGHVNRNKQVHKVIEMLGTNKDLADRLNYVVIGPYDESGEYYKEIRMLIDRFALGQSVQLLGYQPDEVVDQYLSAADIFVNLRFPAMEGASWSLVEQLLAGKPTIVFETGFFAELPDECVVKVPPGDYQTVAIRLRTIVMDPAMRLSLGANGRKLAIEKFSVGNYVQGFMEFIEEVRGWRPQLDIIERVSGDLASMGVGKGMNVVDVVARELGQIFCFAEELIPSHHTPAGGKLDNVRDLSPVAQTTTSSTAVKTVYSDTPTVVVCSLFRNSEMNLPRWREQWENVDYPADRLKFVCTEGDSTDHTSEALQEWQLRNPNVSVQTIDTVLPRYGSVIHPTRMNALSQLANATLESIDLKEVDYVLWIESDLLFSPELLNCLLRHDADIVAPMILIQGTDTFYDIWGFRKQDDQVSENTDQASWFRPQYPYHSAYVADKPFEVDSAGSALLIKAAVLRAGVRFDQDAIVGFCRNARAKGFTIWVDPTTTVWHPHRLKISDPLLEDFPSWEVDFIGKYQEMVPMEPGGPATLGIKEYKRHAQLEIGWIAKRLRKQLGTKTLDISVGPSEIPSFLSLRGLNVTAVIPAGLAAFHRDAQKQWNTAYEVLEQDIDSLNLAPDSLEQAVCLFALSLLEDPKDIIALQKIVKACKKHASIFLSLPYDHYDFWRRTEPHIPTGPYSFYNMQAIHERFLNPTGCSLKDFAFIRELPSHLSDHAPIFTHPNNAGIIVLHLEVR